MSWVPQVAHEGDGEFACVANEVAQRSRTAATGGMACRARAAVTPIRRSTGPKGCRLPKTRQIRHKPSIVVARPARCNQYNFSPRHVASLPVRPRNEHNSNRNGRTADSEADGHGVAAQPDAEHHAAQGLCEAEDGDLAGTVVPQ